MIFAKDSILSRNEPRSWRKPSPTCPIASVPDTETVCTRSPVEAELTAERIERTFSWRMTASSLSRRAFFWFSATVSQLTTS